MSHECRNYLLPHKAMRESFRKGKLEAAASAVNAMKSSHAGLSGSFRRVFVAFVSPHARLARDELESSGWPSRVLVTS